MCLYVCYYYLTFTLINKSVHLCLQVQVFKVSTCGLRRMHLVLEVFSYYGVTLIEP